MPQHIWNTVIRPARGTAVGRAVALAHSGAGPNALLPTVRWLPEGIEVVGVTLPGRERRIDEDPTRILDDPEGAVAAVAESCAPCPPCRPSSSGTAWVPPLPWRSHWLPPTCARPWSSAPIPTAARAPRSRGSGARRT